MFSHNLKIALRHLRKYKTQNVISIIGLAVGFVCFAFSALWIRYEKSYDSFHANAERIYRVNTSMFKWTAESAATGVVQPHTPYPLANWLKSNFPEIEDASSIRITDIESYQFLYLDHSFSKIFDINLSEDFFIRGRADQPILVIPELDNEEHYLRIKELHRWQDVHFQATLPRLPANTNIKFNVVVPVTQRYNDAMLTNWTISSNLFDTYILVHDGVNMQALKDKLDKVEIPEFWSSPISLVLTPLKTLRQNDPTGIIQSEIKFAHIQIFAIAGLLVILCALFNHLTLYVTRIRMRLRELALRRVCGATNWQIAATLYADFLLIIILSLVVGFSLMVLLLPVFMEYADIGTNNMGIYSELLIYAVLLITSSFIAGAIPALYYQRQVLNDSIKGGGAPGSRNLFRKGSLLIQLTISLGMMFCATVLIKQIHFLYNTDLGINRRNIASVQARCCPLPPHYAEEIKKIPEVTYAIPLDGRTSLRDMNRGSQTGNYQKDGATVSFTLFLIYADSRFFDFFGVEIIEGDVFYDDFDSRSFVLNEAAMKVVGEIVSKEQVFTGTVDHYYLNPPFNFTGIMRDFYLSPTAEVRPTLPSNTKKACANKPNKLSPNGCVRNFPTVANLISNLPIWKIFLKNLLSPNGHYLRFYH